MEQDKREHIQLGPRPAMPLDCGMTLGTPSPQHSSRGWEGPMTFPKVPSECQATHESLKGSEDYSCL